MLTTLQTIETVLAAVTALNQFTTVKHYPLSEVQSEKFWKKVFQNDASLKLPAFLLVMKDDTAKLKKTERMIEWVGMIMVKSPAGGAELEALPKLDALRGICGSMLVAQKLWVMDESNATIVESDPKYSFIQLDFKTRELNS